MSNELSAVTVTTWMGDGGMPVGYLNGRGRAFPVIHLAGGSSLQGTPSGDSVPYLRALAEVASRLADELVAARAATEAAAVPL